MTQEEKQLALRIFEKAMEDSECIAKHEYYALISVNAAKSIYREIEERDNKDLHEEEARFEAEQAEEAKRKEERKAKMNEARKNAVHYLIYQHNKNRWGEGHNAYIKSSIQKEEDLFSSIFHPSLADMLTTVGVWRISKVDADNILSLYRCRPNRATCKDLICESSADIIDYLEECPSAEDVDLSGYNIGNAQVIKKAQL